jgi:hypothetical protein
MSLLSAMFFLAGNQESAFRTICQSRQSGKLKVSCLKHELEFIKVFSFLQAFFLLALQPLWALAALQAL